MTPHLIRIAARPVRVWRGGRGPALLLLHGAIGDAEFHWHSVWDDLSRDFAVVAPDLPGFGGSGSLPGAPFAAWVEWVAKLVELTGLSDLVLVGNSFGAGLARMFAGLHFEKVRRLVLVNGGHINSFHPALRPLIRTRLVDPLIESARQRTFSPVGLREMVADERLLTPDFLASTEAASHAFVAALRAAAQSDPPLAPIRAPTLIVWGERDRRSPVERGRVLAAEIPGSRLELVPGAGHLPQLEQPARFCQMIRDFSA